jgi:hypothetical protein
MLLKRKSVRLDQARLDRARRFPGVQSEREALDFALDCLIAESVPADSPSGRRAKLRPRRRGAAKP